MEDFVALDFETANRSRASACEVSLVRFANGKPSQSFTTLLKPPPGLDDFENTYIHGITAAECDSAPLLSDVLGEITDFIEERPVVCHNSSFDISVLRKTLDAMELSYPTLTYGCTLVFSRRAFRDDPAIVKFTLASVCRHLKIPFTETHRAEADAAACGQIAAAIMSNQGCVTLKDAAESIGIMLGKLGPALDARCGQQRGSTSSITDVQRGEIAETWAARLGVAKLDPGGEFSGKSVVLTGALQSMPRKEAEALLETVGAIPKSSVSRNTDFLIEGEQDSSQIGPDGVSNKHRKCMELKARGCAIEVLDERMFLEALCD